MTTITTTITEPRTFQQIQDQQNELGRNETMEKLNENVAKLIQTLEKRSDENSSKSSDELKKNELELSRLQLKRAQLGLSRDEKYYSDYSRKYNSKSGIDSSFGISQNAKNNAGAVGLSLLTGGALNPVIAKNLIIQPFKAMTNMLKGFGKNTLSDRSISGKTSSAVNEFKEKALHTKLDQIIGAIKDKSKPSGKKEKREESLFSKVIGSILGLAGTVGKIVLGMIGSVLIAKLGEKLGPTVEGLLSKVVGRKAAGGVKDLLDKFGPEMIAGYAIGGWKGALLGGGLALAWNVWRELKGETKKTPEQIKNEDEALQKINSYIPIEFLKFNNMEHFKATLAGLMLGGLKGAAVGWAFGKYSNAIKKWIGKVPSDNSDQDTENNEETEDDWKKTLAKELGLDNPETVMPIMAGFYLKGISGAAFGYLAGTILAQVSHIKQLEKAIQAGDELEEDELKKQLEKDRYKIALSGALAGFRVGGFSGAILGGIIGLFGSGISEGWQKYGNLETAFTATLEQSYFGVPASVWVGSLGLAGLAWKSGLGIPGIVCGLVAGTIGGYIYDMMHSKSEIEKMGFEAERKGLSYVIKGTDINIAEVKDKAREELNKEMLQSGKKYEITEDMVRERAKEIAELEINKAEIIEKKKEEQNLKNNIISFVGANREIENQNPRKEAMIKARDESFKSIVNPFINNLKDRGIIDKSILGNLSMSDEGFAEFMEKYANPKGLSVQELSNLVGYLKGAEENEYDKAAVVRTVLKITDPEKLKEFDKLSGNTDNEIKESLQEIAKNTGKENGKNVEITVSVNNNTPNEVTIDKKEIDKNGKPINR